MSYSGGMCNGFADDVDVPTLSELDRELVGEGSHRCIVYSMKFVSCPDAMGSFLDSYDAHLVMIEKLPNGVFADPFELRHLVEQKGENQTPRLTMQSHYCIHYDNSFLSNRSAVEVHVDLRPSTSANCNLIIDLPLHARYPVRFYKLSVVTNLLLHMLLYGKFAFSILEISLH
jgi:GPI mannosyltransferase 1 subunit X